MTESEVKEEKSEVRWDGHQKFDIIKTIVAFANGEGGTLLIRRFVGDERSLDSARLDDLVNKYVRPRIGSISSEKGDDSSWQVIVNPSSLAPHVIAQEGSYTDPYGKVRSAFYPGQIFVRHS